MKSTVKLSEGIIPKEKPVQLKSGTLTRLINPSTSTLKNVGVSLLVMNPGDEVAPHYHKKREEVYYIISGEGIAIHKENGREEEIRLEKNMAIAIPENVIHDIKCTGSEPLRILVIFSPPLPLDDAHCA